MSEAEISYSEGLGDLMRNKKATVNALPDECPICQYSIKAE
ncbi:hypothetical protein [Sporosarcina luteola]|nr:hypothetical protein [Sporosarcina luteola]